MKLIDHLGLFGDDLLQHLYLRLLLVRWRVVLPVAIRVDDALVLDDVMLVLVLVMLVLVEVLMLVGMWQRVGHLVGHGKRVRKRVLVAVRELVSVVVDMSVVRLSH